MANRERRNRPEPAASKPGASLFSRLLSPVLIAALGLVAGVLVLQVSVAGVFRAKRPEIALRLAPFDARARSELADRLLSSAPASMRAPAVALALDSVRRDPLQPQALRVLAQSVGSPGAPPKSSEAAIMFQAERLTRRDYLIQIWLIRYYLNRDDIGSVMRHFDIALRSSARARPTIFALLTESAKIPAFRKELERTLGEKSVWADEFAQYLVANSTDFDWATQTAFTLFDPRDENAKRYFQTLLNRLADAGRYELAWSVHERVAPRQTAQVGTGLVDGFELSSGLAPFDWTFTEEPDLWASPEKDERGRTILRVAAHNGESGEVARRLVRLSPGAYRMQVRMGDLPDDLQERPELAVSCAATTADAPLVRLRDSTVNSKGSLVQARLLVPESCAFQWITISASSLASSPDIDPWLGDLQITLPAQ